ncbi:MAG: protein-export chaperone SecB [Gammaproteobacteria bacterium]|jgi:preprotein translocase subunit SecB|nr:protein-export chaperone SecB [Gammaproteobacteria bacterium]
MTAQEQNHNPESVFSIQRVYLKDCSFEVPHSPEIFRIEWQPNVEFELQILTQALADDVFEVIVAGTVTATVDKKVAFLAEVKQAGIFTLKNIPEEQMPLLLNIVCPNILFPYFRETVSSLTARGTFPQLTLDPINFEALYQQRLAQQATGNADEGSKTIQ